MGGTHDLRLGKAVVDTMQKHEVERELTDAIGNSQEVLLKVTTAFPVTLFPDTVVVDRSKVSITHRAFFRVGESLSIRIEDILNVTANVGPIFGSIKLATRFFDPQRPYGVNWFWREDALKLKRILQGYLIAQQKEVDCSMLSGKELTKLLDELGQSAAQEEV